MPDTMLYHAESDPTDEAWASLGALAPTNPFMSTAYVKARRDLGTTPWLLTLNDGARIGVGCPAFLQKERFGWRLEIPSSPATEDSTFWTGLTSTCRRLRVTSLLVHTYGSRPGVIPRLHGEVSRWQRAEHVVELGSRSQGIGYATSHRRNIARAEKSGVIVRSVVDEDGCRIHALLTEESRLRRGTSASPGSFAESERVFRSFVMNGAGEIYQAVKSDRVIASVLALVGDRGLYYHSAGSSEEARAMGATHLIVDALIQEAKKRCMDVVNLGGTRASMAGLTRFKAGFGSTPVLLEAVSCAMGLVSLRGLMTRSGTPR